MASLPPKIQLKKYHRDFKKLIDVTLDPEDKDRAIKRRILTKTHVNSIVIDKIMTRMEAGANENPDLLVVFEDWLKRAKIYQNQRIECRQQLVAIEREIKKFLLEFQLKKSKSKEKPKSKGEALFPEQKQNIEVQLRKAEDIFKGLMQINNKLKDFESIENQLAFPKIDGVDSFFQNKVEEFKKQLQEEQEKEKTKAKEQEYQQLTVKIESHYSKLMQHGKEINAKKLEVNSPKIKKSLEDLSKNCKHLMDHLKSIKTFLEDIDPDEENGMLIAKREFMYFGSQLSKTPFASEKEFQSLLKSLGHETDLKVLESKSESPKPLILSQRTETNSFSPQPSKVELNTQMAQTNQEPKVEETPHKKPSLTRTDSHKPSPG